MPLTDTPPDPRGVIGQGSVMVGKPCTRCQQEFMAGDVVELVSHPGYRSFVVHVTCPKKMDRLPPPSKQKRMSKRTRDDLSRDERHRYANGDW